jgi:[protein-PII] uridylyltransferase
MRSEPGGAPPPPAVTGEAMAELTRRRQRAEQAHAAGASGLETARVLSDAVDDAVRTLWQEAGGHPAAALVAVGGYGRREMSPESDIDLVVLHGRRDDVAAPAKSLAYALWDAGLDLASSLHTPNEALRLSAQRLDSQTAFLDARLLSGNGELFGEWQDRLRAAARRSPPRFLELLRQATADRRAKAGDAGAELEPNLKAGRGGLRDLATLGWLAVLGTSEAGEPGALEPAREFLLRVRHQLHWMTRRRTDVLAMRDQAAAAEGLGIPATGLRPEDALMRQLYRHCRQVAHRLDRALYGAGDVQLAAPPAGGEPWPPELRQRLLDLLLGPDPRGAVEALEQEGRWLALLPEWAGIDCLPQRNIYHRFAVDVHCLETVAAIGSLGDQPEPLIAEAAVQEVADRELLALACLLHDIGKGAEEDHAIRGERLARTAATRMGLAPGDVEDLCWLVRWHLLLAETATRRDIRDEHEILRVAEAVGSARRLRLLLALTAADSLATGPSAWGPWKATLVSRLAVRVLHVLERGELVGGDASALAARREAELRAGLAGFPAAEVAAHLANMPREWLLSEPPAELLRQSQAMLQPPRAGEVAIAADLQPEPGIWQVLVVTRDRPGLFAKVSGTLALHGLNVLGAEIYTRDDGLALEVFRLAAIGDEERRFERVREDLAKVLVGRLSLDMRLAEKRRDYRPRVGKGSQAPPRVVIDNQSSDFYTLIDVHAEDRVGLLYAVTKTLADLMLDIHKAKVSTYGQDVVDVFYVRDLDGLKITDPEHAHEVEASILYAVGTVGASG